VSAAGNYVDIRCGDAVYLLRSSLRQMEDALPRGRFVRVHRSHLVNTGSLLHMTRTAAGNGSVVVRGGHVVPMSKKYRSLLKSSCGVRALAASSGRSSFQPVRPSPAPADSADPVPGPIHPAPRADVRSVIRTLASPRLSRASAPAP